MGRLAELQAMVQAQRVGFLVEETMSGTHRLLDDVNGRERPFSFTVTWGSPHVSKFLNPVGKDFLVSDLRGRLSADGLVDDAPVTGILALRYFQDASIRYQFRFQDAQGTPYEYRGEKRDLRPWNLHRTHTTCYGEVINLDTNQVVSEGVVHFKMNTLPAFLWSMRLA